MEKRPYKQGDYYMYCDRTGVRRYSSEMAQEWNGRIVRKDIWFQKHPQLTITGVPDVQSVPVARPKKPDVDQSINDFNGTNLFLKN